MKLHQSGDKIIVTELRPISEAPLDWSQVLAVSSANKRFGILRFNDASNMFITSDGRSIHDYKILGFIPMPIHQPESNSQDKAALYEKLRKLNPREFAELHERNLRGEGSFDDLVSRLP